jgi:hypothetical protein
MMVIPLPAPGGTTAETAAKDDEEEEVEGGGAKDEGECKLAASATTCTHKLIDVDATPVVAAANDVDDTISSPSSFSCPPPTNAEEDHARELQELFDYSNTDTGTGVQVWDCSIVLALALPRLLADSDGDGDDAAAAEYAQYTDMTDSTATYTCTQIHRAGSTVLELGCGLAVAGVAAAMAGHHVIATDTAYALAAARETGAANVAAIERAGGSFRCETLDWCDLPAWALATTWDAVIGADIIFEDTREMDGDRVGAGASAQQQDGAPAHALVTLLSTLKFRACLLAERERHLEVTADFLRRLVAAGLTVAPTDVVAGGDGGGGRRGRGAAAGGVAPVTQAVDVVVWRVT